MSHLGDLAAALADNELSHESRDKALAHLTRCAGCRLEVDRQRRLRSLLANQADPQVSSGLAARLRAIADEPAPPTELGESRHGRRWPLLAAASFAPTPSRPTGSRRPRLAGSTGRPAQSRGRRTVRRALAGSAVALALTAGLATAGGPVASGGPATTPPVDRFVQEHTVMTARLPFGDAGAGVVESVVLGR
jgi:hypothetical protein